MVASASQDFNFGYAEVSIDKTTYAITLNSFAYETTANAPIVAGAIPEPMAIAPLALGGLMLGRRRR